MLTAITIVILAFMLKKRVRHSFESARDKILLTVNGKTNNKADSFCVSYIHSHGLRIVNAQNVDEKDATSANVKLIQGNAVILLKFKNGAVARAPGEFNSNNQVLIKLPFAGEMLFKHSVCGCENIAPQIILIITEIIGIIFLLIGLFLILVKESDDSIKNSHSPK